MDCDARKWVEPLIPSQQCTSEGTSWTFTESDFIDLPTSHRILGTFQVGKARSFDEIRARVPLYDGLHPFLRIADGHAQKFHFLRVAGELRVAAPDEILVDDWISVIQAHRDRLNF